MNRLALTAIAAIALTTAARGRKDDVGQDIAADSQVTASASDVAVPPAEPVNSGRAFANAAAASDIFEIETSKLAARTLAPPT